MLGGLGSSSDVDKYSLLVRGKDLYRHLKLDHFTTEQQLEPFNLSSYHPGGKMI